MKIEEKYVPLSYIISLFFHCILQLFNNFGLKLYQFIINALKNRVHVLFCHQTSLDKNLKFIENNIENQAVVDMTNSGETSRRNTVFQGLFINKLTIILLQALHFKVVPLIYVHKITDKMTNASLRCFFLFWYVIIIIIYYILYKYT